MTRELSNTDKNRNRNMTTYTNTPAAAQILLNAYLATPLAVEKVSGFDHPLNEIDALRFGDQVFTMSDAIDEDGYPYPGYTYTWGTVTEVGYEDESGHKWAVTPDDARAAIDEWLARLA